jgi:hypothetical protein
MRMEGTQQKSSWSSPSLCKFDGPIALALKEHRKNVVVVDVGIVDVVIIVPA